MKKILIPLFSASILLSGWQALAFYVNQPDLLPPLSGLVQALYKLLLTGEFYQSVGMTIYRGIVGIVISFCAAWTMAALFSKRTVVYELFNPLLVLMRSVPVISFILLALLFLQPENIPLIIAFLTMFPLLCENLTQGFNNMKREKTVLSSAFGMRNINRYAQIVYPQIKPFLFSGLSSAVGFGWRAIIMGEVLSQCTFGIGSGMKRAQTFIDVPSLMAWTLTAIIISFLTEKGITRLANCKFPVFYRRSPSKPAPITTDPVLLLDICKSYGNRLVLDHVSFTFESGKIYGIIAPSGKGKSTLLNLINGSVRPSSGSVVVPQQHGISCVFQEPQLLTHLTVLENVCLPLASVYTKDKARNTGHEFLARMEIGTLWDRYPPELSYGQQQRVAIARAMAYPSPVLLMDEPFKGLEQQLIKRIAFHIRELHRHSGQTIIFVTHKPEELALLAQQTIKL